MILTRDPAAREAFWLTREYFPEFVEQDLKRLHTMSELKELFGVEVRFTTEGHL